MDIRYPAVLEPQEGGGFGQTLGVGAGVIRRLGLIPSKSGESNRWNPTRLESSVPRPSPPLATNSGRTPERAGADPVSNGPNRPGTRSPAAPQCAAAMARRPGARGLDGHPQVRLVHGLLLRCREPHLSIRAGPPSAS